MLRSLLVPTAALVLSAALASQAVEARYATRDVAFDSGYLTSSASGPARLELTAVRAAGASWLRLRFGAFTNLPVGSRLVLTGKRDGAVQYFDAVSLLDYRHGSAYFNGDQVDVALEVPAAAVQARVAVTAVEIGQPDLGSIGPSTICGPTDDRALSSDPRQGRQYPTGCSSWLVNELTVLTAGHCSASAAQQVHFNVPLSTGTGGLVFPPPQDQYPYDAATLQRLDAGVGSDWTVTTTVRNSNTRQYPGQKQGSWYQLGAVPSTPAGQNIRITGYGTVAAPVSLSWQQVQKTHLGTLSQVNATSLCYATDTTGGNSGSPVIHENTGNAIGIHTHGGCTSTGGCNSGTRIDRADLQAAVASRSVLKSVGKWSTFGSGCMGTVSVGSLVGIGYPDLGFQPKLAVSGVRSNQLGALLLGTSNTSWNGNPLPFDLSSIGMNGCSLRTSSEVSLPLATGAGAPSLTLAIPLDLALRGVKFYAQYANADAGANLLGVVVTNGLQGLVGD